MDKEREEDGEHSSLDIPGPDDSEGGPDLKSSVEKPYDLDEEELAATPKIKDIVFTAAVSRTRQAAITDIV